MFQVIKKMTRPPMKYLPKINQLKSFQAITHYRSIRAAARAMNVSQPALTRSIKELENTLGSPLIIRGVSGIELTEAGKLFLARTEVILSELKKATEELQLNNNQAEGSLSIGCSSLILLTIYPKMLADFKKYYPKTTLYLKEGQLSSILLELRENRLDFAVGSVSEHIPLHQFVEEPLFDTSFSIICRKGSQFERCTHINQLTHANWIMPVTDMGYYQQLKTFLEDQNYTFQSPPLFTDSAICSLNLVLNNDYLVIMAKPMAKPLLLKNALSEIALDLSLPKATYSLIYPRNIPPTTTAERMMNILRWHCEHINWNMSY